MLGRPCNNRSLLYCFRFTGVRFPVDRLPDGAAQSCIYVLLLIHVTDAVDFGAVTGFAVLHC